MTYVSFHTPFSKPPVVVVSPSSTVPGTTIKGVSVSNITKEGFNIYVTRINETDTIVKWIAIA